MKYKLLKQLLELEIGVVFEWNEKRKMYVYKDWTLTKEVVEKIPEWFTKVV